MTPTLSIENRYYMKIELKGLKNIRDLGGIAATGGRTVKPKLFIRSDSLDKLSPEGRKQLIEECHISTIIDLRTDMEREERPIEPMEGVEYLHIPLFRDSVVGITRERGADMGAYIKKTWNHRAIREAIPHMMPIYAKALLDVEVVAQLRNVIHTIISNATQGKTTLFHCTVGKDRTGAVAALLLDMLGVERKAILRDYARSNHYMRPKAFKDAILLVLIKTAPVAAWKAWRANIADKDYLRATFDSITERYGSTSLFYRHHLLINEELHKRFLSAALV